MSKSKKCIHCENEVRTRGLCISHYQQFSKAKAKLPKELRKEFEDTAIAAGDILPVEVVNPFKDLSIQVAERHGYYQTDDAQAEKNKAELARIREKAKTSGNDDASAGVVIPKTDNTTRPGKRKIPPSDKNTT